VDTVVQGAPGEVLPAITYLSSLRLSIFTIKQVNGVNLSVVYWSNSTLWTGTNASFDHRPTVTSVSLGNKYLLLELYYLEPCQQLHFHPAIFI